MKSDAKQILAIPCPTCGTKPGVNCKLSTGLRRNAPHRDRRLAAQDGTLGDPDALIPNLQRYWCVSFRHRGAEYSRTTRGLTLFEAAAKAIEFFCGPNWKGPRPRQNTM